MSVIFLPQLEIGYGHDESCLGMIQTNILVNRLVAHRLAIRVLRSRKRKRRIRTRMCGKRKVALGPLLLKPLSHVSAEESPLTPFSVFWPSGIICC